MGNHRKENTRRTTTGKEGPERIRPDDDGSSKSSASDTGKMMSLDPVTPCPVCREFLINIYFVTEKSNVGNNTTSYVRFLDSDIEEEYAKHLKTYHHMER